MQRKTRPIYGIAILVLFQMTSDIYCLNCVRTLLKLCNVLKLYAYLFLTILSIQVTIYHWNMLVSEFGHLLDIIQLNSNTVHYNQYGMYSPLQYLQMQVRNCKPTTSKWFFSRNQKSPLGSHTSGSTVEHSDDKLQIKQTPNTQTDGFALRKSQSETILTLRKELKNIKSEVKQLIEEEFIKPPFSTEWLESSGGSSLSRSRSSNIITSGSYLFSEADSHNWRKESAYFSNANMEQLTNLRKQCEKLRMQCIIKDQKQAQFTIKQRELSQQVRLLRKCKEQLTKSIQILQHSLRQTNDELRAFNEHNRKLALQNERNYYENLKLQKNLNTIQIAKSRLEQQLHFRKAENNELIRIIQIKEGQVEELAANYTAQVKSIEMQYRQALQQQSHSACRLQEDCSLIRKKSRTIDSRESLHKYELEKLQNQINRLRGEVSQREKIMSLMMADIKGLEKQMTVADKERCELFQCHGLIYSLNQMMIKMEARRLGTKYRYF